MNEKIHNEDPGLSSGIFQQAGRSNVFHTPDGYFEKLPLEISSRIHHAHQSNSYRKWIPLHFVTAAVCLLLLVTAGIIYYKFPYGKENAYAGFSYDDLNRSGIITEIDESMLVDALAAGNGETTVVSEKSMQDVQSLHDYLIESNTDINLIISEL